MRKGAEFLMEALFRRALERTQIDLDSYYGLFNPSDRAVQFGHPDLSQLYDLVNSWSRQITSNGVLQLDSDYVVEQFTLYYFNHKVDQISEAVIEGRASPDEPVLELMQQFPNNPYVQHLPLYESTLFLSNLSKRLGSTSLDIKVQYDNCHYSLGIVDLGLDPPDRLYTSKYFNRRKVIYRLSLRIKESIEKNDVVTTASVC